VYGIPVDRDAEAYARYLAARAGRADLGPAIEGSIAVPRQVAELALAALERLAAGIALVRPRLASEAVTAAQALLACVEGATFTARSNLPGLSDPRAREERRGELCALAVRARELARAIRDRFGEHDR
ncbi:MAG: hypothetical protein HOP15_02910, partial [Planctomycetes bacterium]|nr:hypothetical protein [Planctomycetota bacterium]